MNKIMVPVIALILAGCSPTASTQHNPLVVREQQTPPKNQSAGIEEKQSETPKPVAPATPAYSPCIQGPKALRFLDSLGFGEARTLEGDNFKELMDHMPPSTKQRVMKLIQDMTFDATVTGSSVTRKDEELPFWFRHLNEEIAQQYISDCSNQLSVLSAFAAQPSMSKMPQAQVAVTLFQSNLEFMKWWLSNYRQKIRMENE
jgi:hypothetical protein